MKALILSSRPSYKSIKTFLVSMKENLKEIMSDNNSTEKQEALPEVLILTDVKIMINQSTTDKQIEMRLTSVVDALHVLKALRAFISIDVFLSTREILDKSDFLHRMW